MEKAGLIGLVKMRLLPCDDDLSLRGDTFQEAIDRDRKEGLIPFYVSDSSAFFLLFEVARNQVGTKATLRALGKD